jgi:DNA-binding MarR family transcriptional regulator
MFLQSLSGALEAQPVLTVTQGAVTPGQFNLLELVAFRGSLSVGEFAVFLRVTPAAASQAVDRLVKRGLLDRRARPGDRRSSLLRVSRKGRHLLSRVRSARERLAGEVLGSLSNETLRRTVEALDRLSRKISAFPAREGGVCTDCGTHFRERCVLRGAGERTCFYQIFGDRERGEAAGPAAARSSAGRSGRWVPKRQIRHSGMPA